MTIEVSIYGEKDYFYLALKDRLTRAGISIVDTPSEKTIKIGIDINYDPTRLLINTLNTSDKSLPLKNYKDLELVGGEEIYGAWTAPFDWNLVAIHSVLLPNEEVMTFGSYAIHEKEEKI